MITHPNPMVKSKPGYWQDTATRTILIQPVYVKSAQPKRWAVFQRITGNNLDLISRHITEEQAVVIAQTIANRIYRKLEKKTARVILPFRKKA